MVTLIAIILVSFSFKFFNLLFIEINILLILFFPTFLSQFLHKIIYILYILILNNSLNRVIHNKPLFLVRIKKGLEAAIKRLEVLGDFIWGIVKVKKYQEFVCCKDGGYEWDVWFEEGWGEVLHLE
jgi:hypothetical protein